MRKHDLEQIMLEFPEAQLVLAGDFNQSLVSANYYGSRNKRIALESLSKGTRSHLFDICRDGSRL